MADRTVDLPDQPPRRSSVGDRGYDYEVGRRTEILLDGVPLTKVISYDCDAGTVLRFVTDEGGRFVTDPDVSHALKETLTGTVEARWKAGQGPMAEPARAAESPRRRTLPNWPRLMDVRMAALYVSRSETTLRERGPAPKRDGRSVLYDIRDLDRWADQLAYEDASRAGLPPPPPSSADPADAAAEEERRFFDKRRAGRGGD